MKNSRRLILILTLVSGFAVHADNDILLRQNLLRKQAELKEVLTINDLLKLEQDELSKLKKIETPVPTEAISIKQAQNLLNSIDPHPVVGMAAYDFYNRKGTEIGFCFGRATYVHLALLRMGVRKDAIKKIWTVGQTGGEVNWIYHVATAVRTTDGNWTVIDSFVGQLITAQEWARQMRTMTIDGKKATFITDAKKFHPGTGTYSRLELGLDLSKQADFYQHYFRDLFKWFGSIDSINWFKKYQLTRVDGAQIKIAPRLRPKPQSPAAKIAAVAGRICRAPRFSEIFNR